MDGWENRYNDLYEFCKKQEIGMVLVNSNEARNMGDSYADMQKHSTNEKYDSPYLLDKNHQQQMHLELLLLLTFFYLNNTMNLYKGRLLMITVAQKKKSKKKNG